MRKTKVYKNSNKDAIIGIGNFHCWGTKVIECFGDIAPQTVAIVEMEDGTVAEVYPDCMQFETEAEQEKTVTTTMMVSDLIDFLRKKERDKKIVVDLGNGTVKALDLVKYVEDEVFYLFESKNGGYGFYLVENEDEGYVLSVEHLKSMLECEASDECWSHSLFNDNASRFEDCEVMFSDGDFDNFDISERFHLLSNICETEDAIIFKCYH